MSEEYFNNEGGGSRDGYTPRNENSENGGHAPRQRFSRGTKVAGSNGYGNSQSGNEGGYSSRYNNEGGYRPRYNNNDSYRSNSDGYRSNNDGYPRRQSSGGYQQRQGGGYNRQGGYQPRENRWGKQRYGNQDRYNNEGGYRPRYNNDGYSPREGAYRSNDGYSPREGGYRSNDGYSPREGGYQPRQGGYQNRGGYNQRGGYSQRGSFGGQRGGFGQQRPKFAPKKRVDVQEVNIDPNQPLRLNKFLANAGVCSRRDADKYIQAGVVTVNGEIVTELGTKVLRSDEVKFHDNPVKIEKKVYVLLNKPKGYVTTSDDPQNRKTVMDLVERACPERIYPVGRLDRNTTGVLLLTNDGELASKLTHPKFLKKKIYHVTTDQNVTAADLRQIAEGITLDDGEIKADAVEYASETDKKQVGIEIHSGKNRIVRRIFESLGYHVVKLDRVYFAGLTKKNVRRGDWRFLTEKEVNMLRMGAFE